MSRLALIALLTLGCGAVGCGSSSEPSQHPPADVGVAEPYDAPPPPAPRRTMKSVPLFGDNAVYNLLIDPTFEQGSPGIGRWYSNVGTSLNGNGPPLTPRVLSASPLGVSLPVIRVFDAPDDGKPRSFSLLAQVPGGSGPYVASVWLSSEKPLDAPLGDTVRVGVANAGTTVGLVAVEVAPDESEQRTIGGRTWLHFRGEIPGPFPIGAFLTLRFKATRTVWYLQGPEVVPKALMAPAQTMSLKVARPMELDAEERAAIAGYQRVPLDYGVGKPR